MKWKSDYNHPKGFTFEIELDEIAGYYFYAYEGDLDLYDGLQDTLEAAKREALREFNVPIDSWVQAE